MSLARLVSSAVLLVLAAAAPLGAQPRPGVSRPLPDLTPRTAGGVQHGVEIGAGSMVLAIFPTIGGHVSIPASQRVRVEFAAHALPWFLEDGEDGVLLTQVQARVPFRAGPPGSRRGLLLGVTGFTVVDRVADLDEWEFASAMRPHAGVSWQWQKSRHIDVRLDVQGVFTFETPIFAVPLATFSMVWHRERGWS
jgi:hypothetical protein